MRAKNVTSLRIVAKRCCTGRIGLWWWNNSVWSNAEAWKAHDADRALPASSLCVGEDEIPGLCESGDNEAA